MCMGRSKLPDGIESMPSNAKFVGNGMDVDEWDTAMVWSPSGIEVSKGVDITDEYPATGESPAVDKAEVEGWTKYELQR